jgi:carbon monoxide dehydrogenase subunit G
MPELKQSFTVKHSRPEVWAQFQNVTEVAQCIPGASLTEQASATQAKGRMTVKLGPVKADFGGEVEIEADEATFTGKIIGTGIDKSHGSRAKGSVVYRLEEAGGGSATTVSVAVDYTLSGSLAQFARGGIVEAVAGQICQEFACNLEEQLNTLRPTVAVVEGRATREAAGSVEAPRPAVKPNELNMLKIIGAVIRAKLRSIFARA